MHKPHSVMIILIVTLSLSAFPFIIQAQKSGHSAANIAKKRFPTTNSSVPSEKKKSLNEAQKLKTRALELAYLKKYDEALPFAERALTIEKTTLGTQHPTVAEDMVLFGAIYEDGGYSAAAESLYKQALAIGEKNFDVDDANTALALESLAKLYRKRKDYARAEPLYTRLLQLREKSSQSQSPVEVAQVLESLIAIYIAKGNDEKAEPLKTRAFAIREKQFGAESMDFAKYLLELSNLYIGKRDFTRAAPLYNRALKIYEKNLGADNMEVIKLKNAWDTLERAQRKKL